jgi:hypothetical protein
MDKRAWVTQRLPRGYKSPTRKLLRARVRAVLGRIGDGTGGGIGSSRGKLGCPTGCLPAYRGAVQVRPAPGVLGCGSAAGAVVSPQK